MKRFWMLIFYSITFFVATAQPKPKSQQLAWHDMEFYLFMHFGPNTFTDLEWGHGNEKEEIFNPENLDCNQWCRIAKAAGAKGIIITAKHHDGFCLWPSKYSKHTVRESKWKNGKGDVLKELSAACKKYGLKFGVYLSPWDRNHPDYGTAKYNDVFVNMLKEVLTKYGSVWELWWDGANGEGPNGKQQIYDWHRFEQTVRKLSPQTVVFSDIGPDIRWCGNENGTAGITNWNYLDTAGFKRGAGAPPQDTLNAGNANGKNWIPAECDVSIRPGWFWHKNEDDKVKTPETLFDLYLKSVGRGANLLLNVPPDQNGLITMYDSLALMGFKKLLEHNFKNDLAANAKVRNTADQFERVIHLGLPAVKKINCLVLEEDIKNGQAISNFYFQLRNSKKLQSFQGTTIGHKRIITFPAMDADYISLHLLNPKQKVSIKSIKAYLIGEDLIQP
ncbi:MAG: alpha-L-fucosidase [Ferruginibacter sp.]